MGKHKRLQNQAGFTILEILVGALVFMIGFSIVIGVLNGTLAKLHVDELTQAGAVGQMVMEQTIAVKETSTLDTIVVRNTRQFRIIRSVQVADVCAVVDLTVSRHGSRRVLLRWYYEFTPSAQ